MKSKNKSANEMGRVFLYRFFCIASLIVAIYLVLDLYTDGALDIKVILLFAILFIVNAWGLLDWYLSYSIQKKQAEELKIYKHYIQPLEELTKDIRMRQHEFDNHMNAVLNMHITIDNYEELVEAQNSYAKGIYMDKTSTYPALLRISDKILAGFLYSKLISAPENLEIKIQVLSQEMITSISEHSLIEIIGTLVDNAIEACDDKRNKIDMVLDGQDDRIIFTIKNQVENMTLSQVSSFFEKGFTTKANKEGHGLGLYQANMLAKKYGGEITVELLENEGTQEIVFRVEI